MAEHEHPEYAARVHGHKGPRYDPAHGLPASIEPDDAADGGTSAYAAHLDHQHAIVAAVAGTIAPDDTAAEGVASSFARSDHRHAITCAAPVSIGTSNSEGVATNFARSDHVHAAGSSTTWQRQFLVMGG